MKNNTQEIIDLTKQVDDLTSDNVDLKEQNVNLLPLLKEIHERMYSMTEYCERLQPIHINDSNKEIVDLTHEMYDQTKLFRLRDLKEMDDFNDQTSRSILEDLRKVIKSLEVL
tara:strand:+ start:1237 stop:1575 length:339 start_codon:yes stop_codon:yes gene_type:complete